MFGDFYISLKTTGELPYYPANKTTILWSGFKTENFQFIKVDNGESEFTFYF